MSVESLPTLPTEPPERDPDALLSVAATAAYLGISPTVVYRLVRYRKIPHFKIQGSGRNPNERTVRFRRADLDAWLDASRVEADHRP